MTIEHLYISPAHNYFGHHGQEPGDAAVIDCAEVEIVAGKGIVGDRFFDFKEDYKGQITFFEAEAYERLCGEFGVHDRPSSVFRRNVITRGIDLNSLIGRRFVLQGCELQGTSECTPCYWMDQAFHPGAEAALRGHGGLRAKIISGGTLRKGPADLHLIV